MGRRSHSNAKLKKKKAAARKKRLLGPPGLSGVSKGIAGCFGASSCSLCSCELLSGKLCQCGGTAIADLPLDVQRQLRKLRQTVTTTNGNDDTDNSGGASSSSSAIQNVVVSTMTPVFDEEEYLRFGGSAKRPAVTIAPMMAWTDHHFRQLVRLIERQWTIDNPCLDDCSDHCHQKHGKNSLRNCGVLLVTEMLESDRMKSMAAHQPKKLDSWISFHADQQPIAAQIGGGDPDVLAEAARRCADAGYAEVNLNVGCPSGPVSGRGYGVALMKNPDHVATIVTTVRRAVPRGCVRCYAFVHPLEILFQVSALLWRPIILHCLLICCSTDVWSQ